MLRLLVLLGLVTFVVWRYLPRVRVSWFAVVVLFLVIVGTRTALHYWG